MAEMQTAAKENGVKMQTNARIIEHARGPDRLDMIKMHLTAEVENNNTQRKKRRMPTDCISYGVLKIPHCSRAAEFMPR